MRYKGQSHELAVRFVADPFSAFHVRHESVYGFRHAIRRLCSPCMFSFHFLFPEYFLYAPRPFPWLFFAQWDRERRAVGQPLGIV